jgi:integrase/recombinase XerD
MARLSIYKYVRTDKGWRYCKAAFHPNGKIKPNVVLVSGVEEKHAEGRYFLNFNNHWIDAGENALEAQRQRLLRLNQVEYERLSGTSLPASSVGHPSVVEFSGRKIIKDEVEAYLADLELTRRIYQFLGRGNWLISKVRMSSPDRPGECGRFHRRRPEDCGSIRSICCRHV